MLNKISSRLEFLMAIGALDDNAWDAINPHGPRYSTAIKEYMMAAIVRDIAKTVTAREIQGKLLSVGKEMVTFASKGLVNGWEEGDDICPPYFRWPRPMPGPDPIPWHLTHSYAGELSDHATQQKQLVASVKLLANLTSQKELSRQLKAIATEMEKHFNKNVLVTNEKVTSNGM